MRGILFTHYMNISLVCLALYAFNFSRVSYILHSIFFCLARKLSPVLVLKIFPRIGIVNYIPEFLDSFLLFGSERCEVPGRNNLPGFVDQELIEHFSITSSKQTEFQQRSRKGIKEYSNNGLISPAGDPASRHGQ